MAEFPEPKNELRNWVNQAIGRLRAVGNPRDYTTDLGHWQRDSDGVFRDAERIVEIWNRTSVNSLFDLPSWSAILDIIHADDRLNGQVDTIVGTSLSSHRFEKIGRAHV